MTLREAKIKKVREVQRRNMLEFMSNKWAQQRRSSLMRKPGAADVAPLALRKEVKSRKMPLVEWIPGKAVPGSLENSGMQCSRINRAVWIEWSQA